jgi:glycosyltransferase involved in cell wall biosynthesis
MPLPKYSIIVPVYNRPQELQELLQSVVLQNRQDIEVIVVEDGSAIRCEDVVNAFRDKLDLKYIYKTNSGPGPSRNVGFEKALGEYFVVFDSDCILPENYFVAVDNGLSTLKLDAWGGPDKGHENFTTLQRAMAYTMSSVLTTGGIRGGKQRVGWFQPRSFNMGISRKVYAETGGFHFDRFAEDIELSIRMKKQGFRVGLIPDAFVYHKRRTSLAEFYKQVSNFGRGRAQVGKKHPSEVRLTHWFPSFFAIGTIAMVLSILIDMRVFSAAFFFFIFYLTAILLHSLLTTRNLGVAIMSVPSALIQFFGYGLGFLKERFKS